MSTSSTSNLTSNTIIPSLLELTCVYISNNFNSLNITIELLNSLPEENVTYILYNIIKDLKLTPDIAILFYKCNHNLVHKLLKYYNIDILNFIPLEKNKCRPY